MRKLLFLLMASIFLASSFVVSTPSQRSAKAYSNSLMITDGNFDRSGSMSAADIQNFLNKYPNSCLKNYTDEYPSNYFTYSGSASAASIIRKVSDLWGINPQVMLTKLEQEENLVTGNAGCPLYRYVSAVGFNCPGPTRNAVFRGTPVVTCVQSDANMGFSRQVTKGAWLLKWGKERANGNLSWLVPDDASYYYGGPMTQGNRQRSSSSPMVYYDGYWNGVLLSSGATASLYNYTPYLNQAFSSVYQNFFGYDPSVEFNPYHSASIFRSYFPRTGEHFYTQDYIEWQTTVRSGAIPEGVVYLMPHTATSKPVYRLLTNVGLHFYTSDVAEKDYLTNVIKFRFEGIAFYAEPNQIPSTFPIYRLRNDLNGDHLYTASTGERDNLTKYPGWKYDGIAWYAY